jgi:hypothetical protein
MGIYAQRIGSIHNIGFLDGGYIKPFYTVQTWVGLKINYKINY